MTMHHRRSVLEHVIVNGSPVVSGGKLTDRLEGRLCAVEDRPLRPWTDLPRRSEPAVRVHSVGLEE